MADHPIVEQAVAAEPELGAADESACLPGWLASFAAWYEQGEGATLSPGCVRALFHTLIAARQRARRLVRERDEALTAKEKPPGGAASHVT